MSFVQTIWSHLSWSDKWVLAINVVLAAIFFASWRNKKRRAREAEKRGE